MYTRGKWILKDRQMKHVRPGHNVPYITLELNGKFREFERYLGFASLSLSVMLSFCTYVPSHPKVWSVEEILKFVAREQADMHKIEKLVRKTEDAQNSLGLIKLCSSCSTDS